MNRWILWALAPPLTIVPLIAPLPAPVTMYPAFVLFRGPGLDQPVLLRHANVVNGNLSRDPLAIVYGSLQAVSIDTTALRKRHYFEVAEFFGAEWTGAIDPADGTPRRALHFE